MKLYIQVCHQYRAADYLDLAATDTWCQFLEMNCRNDQDLTVEVMKQLRGYLQGQEVPASLTPVSDQKLKKLRKINRLS